MRGNFIKISKYFVMAFAINKTAIINNKSLILGTVGSHAFCFVQQINHWHLIWKLSGQCIYDITSLTSYIYVKQKIPISFSNFLAVLIAIKYLFHIKSTMKYPGGKNEICIESARHPYEKCNEIS